MGPGFRDHRRDDCRRPVPDPARQRGQGGYSLVQAVLQRAGIRPALGARARPGPAARPARDRRAGRPAGAAGQPLLRAQGLGVGTI